MNKPQQPEVLGINLHGKRVGFITRLAADRHVFSFADAYLDDRNRPTLSLSFKGQSGGLVSDNKAYGPKLPPFFSNLLPEGHLRDYLAAQANVKSSREFFLLAALGSDLPGALEAVPLDREGAKKPDDVEEGHLDERKPAMLRFSLAGVQLKFSALMEASGGLTVPANGIGGNWIIKLPSARFLGVPENEYAMMKLAHQVGLDVPEVKLVPLSDIQGLPKEAAQLGGQALAVKRFDRRADGTRIHMEDFAQVFGIFPEDKYANRSYANIASVLWAEAGQESVEEFVRRLAFSVLIGNADMHLKNWSLLYPDTKNPVLSPAYDFVSTVAYLPDDRLALGFGGSKEIHRITTNQMRRFAETAGIAISPVMQTVAETIEKTQEAWRNHGPKDLLPKEAQKAISDHMDGFALING